jgi:putative spermidine/putrescine transport system ATP-binding protein
MPSPDLRISGLVKRYGDFVALAPTDLTVPAGEFLTLLGPSGSGKTTLLSLIAGLAQPDEGRILLGSEDITYGAPYERDIGMVFQNYALFPHMTIEENIAFPLKMRRIDGATARRRAAEALEMVRLPHVANRYPRELSGGQQQRIALARCVVYQPSIILMDEPLGALDKKLRDQMQLEIKRIHRELGTTIVYVTHDQEEAMTMSDRICLMNGGRIEQLGTPDALYFRPSSLFVADFLGESNLLPGRVTAASSGGLEVALSGAGPTVQAQGQGDATAPGQAVQVMVRPQNVSVGLRTGRVPELAARVTEVMVTGSLTKLYMAPLLDGMPPLVAAYPTRPGAAFYEIGQVLALAWTPGDAIAIPDQAAGAA